MSIHFTFIQRILVMICMMLPCRALARISELGVKKYKFGVIWVSKNTHLG